MENNNKSNKKSENHDIPEFEEIQQMAYAYNNQKREDLINGESRDWINLFAIPLTRQLTKVARIYGLIYNKELNVPRNLIFNSHHKDESHKSELVDQNNIESNCDGYRIEINTEFEGEPIQIFCTIKNPNTYKKYSEMECKITVKKDNITSWTPFNIQI